MKTESRSGSLPGRIGYILKMFPRPSETFILNEIRELERHGLSLHVFSLKQPTGAPEQGGRILAQISYLPERAIREPLRVLRAHWGVFRRFPGSYLRTLLHAINDRELNPVRRLRRFSQTCCVLNEMGPVRHLHAHFATDATRIAAWARMISNVSYSVTTHAKDIYKDGRLAWPGVKARLSLARFVIANSEHTAHELRAICGLGRRVFVVYNGIDVGAFLPRYQEPTEALLLSVGRLVEKKGFQHLISACELLKQRGVRFRCEIVGNGEWESRLEKSIRDRGLHEDVRIVRWMTQEELHLRYAQAMVFVLPCVVAADGDIDVMPNVIKEAMAIGVPVLTTRLPGIEELIVDGVNGLLVPPGDANALAGALESLLGDAALRRRLATRARRVIEERFDMRVHFARLQALLCEAAPQCNGDVIAGG